MNGPDDSRSDTPDSSNVSKKAPEGRGPSGKSPSGKSASGRGKAVDRDSEERRIAAMRTQKAALVLLILALLSSLWAWYLWGQLIESRQSGAAPVCAFGDTNCGALWDADFAAWVHDQTGLPVAAWGVAWGLAALLTSLCLWLACWRSRGTEASLPLHATWNGAVHVVAALGVLSILVLAGASAAAGLFCSSCAVTYVTVLAFGAICFFGLPSPGASGLGQGFGVAALTTIGVALGLLLLGPVTPPSIADSLGDVALSEGRGASSTPTRPTDTSPAPTGQAPTTAPGDQLGAYLATLPPQGLQSVSDTLDAYRQAPAIVVPPPRALIGEASAPVRITVFTDTLCSHCANLHHTLEQLMMMAPRLFSIDSRQYPLDPGCNPHIGGQGGPPGVRCMAALIRICVESSGHRMEIENRLYANQRALDESNIYSFVVPPLERMLLDACIGSDATAASLAQDIETVWQLKPHGTPVVLVNDKQALFYPPLLLALILAQGDTEHEAFDALPAPQPLPDEHEGHQH